MTDMKSNNLVYFYFFFILLLLNAYSCRKSDYVVEDDLVIIRDNGWGTGTTTWTNDKTYLLEGFVFVNDGQTLTIEPGTIIHAKIGQGSGASALIVAKGGKILAKGTSSEPIIFTVEGDDLDGSVPLYARGLWGGVIILGNARLNLSAGEAHIEGIPLTEPRGLYGGFDDEDNSGEFIYVSIRHGGTNIGEGNEINGLTLGGVGSKTIIHHIEVISIADDGFEFFGGNVNCSYLVAAFCGDDAFDYDMGYRGMGQFWFAVQEPSYGDKLIECNGGIDPIIGIPYSMPKIFNATLIGSGLLSGRKAMLFDRNAGGVIANSIVINQSYGVYIEYIENSDDSYKQFENGNLEIKNNIFYDVADDIPDSVFMIAAASGTDITSQSETFSAYFSLSLNMIQDPEIEITESTIDPIPRGDIHNQLAPYQDTWFENVQFKGAFYTYNWLLGWTLLNESGYIKPD